MEGGFDFANEQNWPTQKLLKRLGQISWQTEHIAYSPERKSILDHESRTIVSEVQARTDPPTLPLELQ